MKEVGIAICDDEKKVREETRRLLEDYKRKSRVHYKIFSCSSGSELLEISNKIHIALFDIGMPGMDGIQAVKELKKRAEIKTLIMLTAKKDCFKDAIRIGVARFVTKPIDENELYEAIEYALSLYPAYETVRLSYKGTPCLVQQSEILMVESHRDFLKIYTKERVFESAKSLKELGENLEGGLFFSPHRSYLVNLMHVRDLEREKLILDAGFAIPVSRRNRKMITQKMIDYDVNKN